MDRSTLFNQLNQSMMAIGKDMRESDFHCNCSPAQQHVLMVLGSYQPMPIKELAATLQVTSAAATQHVDALVKQGYVSRAPKSEDRRVILVALTLSGQQLVKELSEAHAAFMYELFSGLTDTEFQCLVALFKKASETYSERKEKGGHSA